ncbi:MAG: hypothetical protein QM754_19530 [Tepidisphaeraceae bacterium]
MLLALGLAITFGLMGVINMAHGEMMMIGAVTTWACFEFLTKPVWNFTEPILGATGLIGTTSSHFRCRLLWPPRSGC